MDERRKEPGALPTLWAQAGGEAVVRPLISELVARMRADIMIGFFFRRTRPERLVELEVQHASSHLGGPFCYQGRPMAEAHARFPIQAGHFARRRQILSELLAQFDLPANVAAAWLSAQDAVVDQVVRPPNACPTPVKKPFDA